MEDPEEYAKTWKELNEKHPELKWLAFPAGLIALLLCVSCLCPQWIVSLIGRACCQ